MAFLYLIVDVLNHPCLVLCVLSQLHQQGYFFQPGSVSILGTQICGEGVLAFGVVVVFLYGEDVPVAVTAEEHLVYPQSPNYFLLFFRVLPRSLILQYDGLVVRPYRLLGGVAGYLSFCIGLGGRLESATCLLFGRQFILRPTLLAKWDHNLSFGRLSLQLSLYFLSCIEFL